MPKQIGHFRVPDWRNSKHKLFGYTIADYEMKETYGDKAYLKLTFLGELRKLLILPFRFHTCPLCGVKWICSSWRICNKKTGFHPYCPECPMDQISLDKKKSFLTQHFNVKVKDI